MRRRMSTGSSMTCLEMMMPDVHRGARICRARSAEKARDAYPVGSGCAIVGCGLAVGRGAVQRAEAEQCLEGGHRVVAAVVAEDVLVEVDGQVLVADAAVSAVHPGFEVRDGAVRTREQLLAGRGRALLAPAMLVAEP